MSGTEVRGEQIRTLYRQSAAVFAAHPVNAAIVCAVYWRSTSESLLLGWWGLTTLAAALRVEFRRRYLKAAPTSAELPAWGRLFALGSAISGSVWGLGCFWFFGSGSPLSQILMPFAIGGMCAAAAGMLSAYLPAFVAFVAPALSALMIRALWLADPPHLGMAAMIVVYGVGLTFAATVNHRSITEAFRLRFENDALLEQLSQAQEHLTETNHTLERRVAERTEALQRQAEALREAQRMESVGRLAGGIAHDFNNLLTVMLANLVDLLRGNYPPQTERTLLAEAYDAANRGADLVRQLLMFSRRQKTSPETLDLNQVVSGMQRFLSRTLGGHVTLSVELHDQPLYVHMDPSQLEQIILNLATNARDAMPAGGKASIETRAIEGSAREDDLGAGSYVMLSVRDTGGGMDDDTRRRIFEPFFTTKEVGKGTGLGLATVYGIVEQSGGSIKVESELSRGSNFRIYLPRAEVPKLIQQRRPTPRPELSVGATVLLVEDEEFVRSVVERMLTSAGHRVLVAESADRALELASDPAFGIDLLLSDVVMPKMGGPELLQRLRSARPSLKALLMSGYSRDHVLPIITAGGGVEFLSKPFTMDALLQKVATLVGGVHRRITAPPEA